MHTNFGNNLLLWANTKYVAGYAVSKNWKCARLYLQMCKNNKVGKHYHNCKNWIPAQVENKVLDRILIITKL